MIYSVNSTSFAFLWKQFYPIKLRMKGFITNKNKVAALKKKVIYCFCDWYVNLCDKNIYSYLTKICANSIFKMFCCCPTFNLCFMFVYKVHFVSLHNIQHWLLLYFFTEGFLRETGIYVYVLHVSLF